MWAGSPKSTKVPQPEPHMPQSRFGDTPFLTARSLLWEGDIFWQQMWEPSLSLCLSRLPCGVSSHLVLLIMLLLLGLEIPSPPFSLEALASSPPSPPQHANFN